MPVSAMRRLRAMSVIGRSRSTPASSRRRPRAAGDRNADEHRFLHFVLFAQTSAGLAADHSSGRRTCVRVHAPRAGGRLDGPDARPASAVGSGSRQRRARSSCAASDAAVRVEDRERPSRRRHGARALRPRPSRGIAHFRQLVLNDVASVAVERLELAIDAAQADPPCCHSTSAPNRHSTTSSASVYQSVSRARSDSARHDASASAASW